MSKLIGNFLSPKKFCFVLTNKKINPSITKPIGYNKNKQKTCAKIRTFSVIYKKDLIVCVVSENFPLRRFSSVQFSSVTQSCPTLCDPMNLSTPGLPVHHQLLEFTQTHVRRVGDAIQPSHPLLSPSPPAPQSLPGSESFPMSQLFA